MSKTVEPDSARAAPRQGKARDHSDAELVAECQDGDTAAFDELVRRYKDRLYNVVYRFVGNHADALDVVQETFVRAYRGIDTYKGHAQVYTWLYTIAANLARNHLRDRGRKGRDKGTSLEALGETAPLRAQHAMAINETPRTLAQQHELEEALQDCLDRLPGHYRLVFVLRTYEDLNYEEIALSVGCPQGTVKSRLNQARRHLAECLKKHGLM